MASSLSWSAILPGGLYLIIQKTEDGVVAEAGQLPRHPRQVRGLLHTAPDQPLQDRGDGEEGLLQAGDVGPHGDQVRPEAGSCKLSRLMRKLLFVPSK